MPPATAASHSPSRRARKAWPSATVADAQAPVKVRLGPFSPSLMARFPAGALGIVIGTVKGLKWAGVTRSAMAAASASAAATCPSSRRRLSTPSRRARGSEVVTCATFESRLENPPMPVPKKVPERPGSQPSTRNVRRLRSFSPSRRAAAASASSAAAIAMSAVGSRRRASIRESSALCGRAATPSGAQTRERSSA